MNHFNLLEAMCGGDVWGRCVGAMCGGDVWGRCVGAMCGGDVWASVKAEVKNKIE